MVSTVNIRDSYKFYKKNIEEPIPIKIYIYIVNGFIQFMVKKIMSGKDIRLPARMGIIGIRGKKVTPKLDEQGEIKGLAPNWPKTKELWDRNPKAKESKELVYCFNEHTNGLRYRFVWWKKNVLMTNKTLYSLKLCRANKRMVSNLVNKGTEYLETR